MKILVTCGPACAPLDDVRRLTNFSTGSLGFYLSRRLTRAGFEVVCFKGALSVSREPLQAARVETFLTNDELLEKLAAHAQPGAVHAVLHLAALCDYRVAAIRDAHGNPLRAAKIPSRRGRLFVELVPAKKVIRQLRRLFPDSLIYGWKYELEGTREDAVQAALRQIRNTGVTACIVNGAAYGSGFGVCRNGQLEQHLSGRRDLAAFFLEDLRGHPPQPLQANPAPGCPT